MLVFILLVVVMAFTITAKVTKNVAGVVADVAKEAKNASTASAKAAKAHVPEIKHKASEALQNAKTRAEEVGVPEKVEETISKLASWAHKGTQKLENYANAKAAEAHARTQARATNEVNEDAS